MAGRERSAVARSRSAVVAAMDSYNCYLFDGTTRVTRAADREFSDDADAVRWADDQFTRGERYTIVEVWQRGRLIHRRQR